MNLKRKYRGREKDQSFEWNLSITKKLISKNKFKKKEKEKKKEKKKEKEK